MSFVCDQSQVFLSLKYYKIIYASYEEQPYAHKEMRAIPLSLKILLLKYFAYTDSYLTDWHMV